MLFDESGEGGGAGYSVYIRKLDGSPAVRLGEGSAQALSPDLTRAAAVIQREGRGLIRLYPTGVGEAMTIDVPGLSVGQLAWTRDGSALILEATEGDRGHRLYVREFAGEKARAISPEGYRLLRRARVPTGEGRGRGSRPARISLPPGRRRADADPGLDQRANLRWRPDGKSIYVQRFGGIPGNVWILDLATGKRELWKQLVPADPPASRRSAESA